MAKSNKSRLELIFGKWEYRRTNYYIFIAAVADLVLAYIIMATGATTSFQSVSLAPVMLVIGYLILIPLAILYRPGMFSRRETPD